MTYQFASSVEPLEQRIAPAGLVTASFANGLLTVTGFDGADHDVELVKTGTNTFRLEGSDTSINLPGVTSKNFTGTLSRVVYEGGSGADTFTVTNLSSLKSLRFEGNEGVDSLSTANLKTGVGSTVDINLGADTGSVNFFGSQTVLHGVLNINLGGGGSAGLRSALTTIDGAVTVTGGPGSDSLSLTGATTLFKSKLTFSGLDGNDSFNSAGKSVTVQGLVAMDGGAGTNSFVFAADRNSFGKISTIGSVDLKLGTGAGSVSFLGASTNLLGTLKIDLGTGGGSADLNSVATTIRDGVQFIGGIGNDSVEFNGRVSLGKTLSFVGGAGDDTFGAVGGLFSVKGATSFDPGVGASTFVLHPSSLALAALSVQGGIENDTVSIIADGTIAGDVNLLLGIDGTGPSSIVLESRAGLANGLKFAGAVTIGMTGATVDVLTIANIQVAKGFTAQTGEGVSTVDIVRLNVLGDLSLKTGAGADVVNLDNLNARNLTVDTQVGADELRIERNAAYTGISKILARATILTGIGADQIRIGNGIDFANTRVNFMGALTLDAGDGANMRNDILGSNFFELAPKLTSTGGTLTETAAV